MHSSLIVVTDRFPSIRERAVRLFEHDEGFQELCEEYEMCARAEERLDSPSGKETPIRKEYTALRLRIEGELLRYLQDRAEGD